MSSRRIISSAGPVIVAVFAMTVTALQAQNTKLIDVNGSRPLAAALDALEIVTGNTINYEDPPYENEADLQDVSTPEQRASKLGYRLLVPRVGRVAAEVDAAAVKSPSDNYAVVPEVDLLLVSYRQKKLPGDFKVEQANGMLYVTPTKVLGANGVMRDVTSPMMALVTVPFAERSVAATMEAILNAVHNATGLRIVIGNFPFRPKEMVSFGASEEPARDALSRLFSQTARERLSYRLAFDPRPDRMRIFDYMINVQRTGYVSPKPPAAPRPTPAPAATSQQPANSGANPFFTKPK